jgi:multisubunit Na+/H+ antiporter MnhG subunit
MIDMIALKKVTIDKVLIVLSAFLLPIKPLIILVGLCIFLDTIFGVWKAKKTNNKITSKGLSSIVSKMVLYQSAVILFFALEKFLVGDFILLFTSIPLFLTKVIATLLVGIELTSISENIEEATGVSVWQRIKIMLGRVKEIKNDVNDVIKNDE